jgi:predicted transcriptional regulator
MGLTPDAVLARQLGLTQPAVSMSINRGEALTGWGIGHARTGWVYGLPR